MEDKPKYAVGLDAGSSNIASHRVLDLPGCGYRLRRSRIGGLGQGPHRRPARASDRFCAPCASESAGAGVGGRAVAGWVAHGARRNSARIEVDETEISIATYRA